MDRRELIRIVGVGLLAANAQADYKPRVLSPSEYETLERMLDILLPSDANSPGAREAGVAMYIDTSLKYGDPRQQERWRSSLHTIDPSTLPQLAERESNPQSEPEKFFVIFKRAALDAYYLSEAGRKSLGYHGDTSLHHFDGCTHREHKPE